MYTMSHIRDQQIVLTLLVLHPYCFQFCQSPICVNIHVYQRKHLEKEFSNFFLEKKSKMIFLISVVLSCFASYKNFIQEFNIIM